jgi:putative DNA methylase
MAEFPGGESEYHAWFMSAIGILGDPVEGRRRINAAKITGERLADGGYGYVRAFTRSPDRATIARIARVASFGHPDSYNPIVLDPFAGGGSIPLESARLGFTTIANELNPVAVAVLNATVSLPSKFGPEFSEVIRKWGDKWAARVRTRLEPYFPMDQQDGSIIAFIWAHTVPCPTTGFDTPLAPDYWLSKGAANGDIAVRVVPDFSTGKISFEVIQGKDVAEYGERSTYKRGTGTSVWTGETFSGEYIRSQAAAGRLGSTVLAVALKRPADRVKSFRAPSQDDLNALEAASVRVASQRSLWETKDLIPSEEIPEGTKTDEPRRMSIHYWRDMFTDRQLLSAVTALDELHQVVGEAQGELGPERAKALALYLGFALDKLVDRNSRFSGWLASTQRIHHVFDRHDFSFKWSFAEFDAARAAIPWCVKQVADTMEATARMQVIEASMAADERRSNIVIMQGSATTMALADKSVQAVVTDPPYYDNVMYAECSDYFYVWLKRSLQDTWPELCTLSLTDKEREAVANRSLFVNVATKGVGKKKAGEKSAADLADEHYEDLLTQSFREAHRILTDDGVLTVMFTHKRIDAWDTLGQAILNAGFSINSSWPVHTESEISLHQAKKNSASSTIFLTCRKRASSSPAYWTDIRNEVSSAARVAASEFASFGLSGIDLTISTFGPVLSVLSRNWPVYTGELDSEGEPQVLRPDVALDLAREEVSRLKKRGLLGGRDVEFDRVTDWYLLAWADFAAAEFPYDEGRKLSIAVHLEMDDLVRTYKLVRASSGSILILSPAQRRTAGGFDPEAASWPTLIDSLHALMLVYEEEGLAAAGAWLLRTGMVDDQKFKDLVEAAIHAIPRVKDKGEFARSEAATLEGLRTTLFDDIAAPVDADVNIKAPAQLFELG